MLGSKLARLQRPFIKQSSVPEAINQNLRPKISNYAYHNSKTNSGVQNSMNYTYYMMPNCVAYQEFYSRQTNGQDEKYRMSQFSRADVEMKKGKKTKEEILKDMCAIGKVGGDIEEQLMLLLDLPFELDIRDFTKAIQNCNSMSLSYIIMKEIRDRGLIPDLLLYNVYIKKCEDFKDKEAAFQAYNQLLADHVQPDKHTMIVLLRCCLQSNSPSEAEAVLSDAFQRCIEVNSYMYNLLIDYFARHNQPTEAFRLRLQMNAHHISPDEYTISSLMAACCPCLPSKSLLLVLLEDVKTSPLPARSVCVSALFSGIAKATHLENHQKLKIILSFYDTLRSRGYIFGQHAYTSMMTCCAKIGAIDQAKLFLKDMSACGVEWNQYICTAFISTCSKAKDYATALNIFNYMRSSYDSRENKKRPNKYTYEAMLVAAGNAGQFEDAMRIFQDMMEEGIRPDISTYARLIIVCGLCKNIMQGEQFMCIVNEYQLTKTSFYYHAVIDYYSRCGDYNRAKQVLHSIASSGILSHHHYEPIIRLLVERENWNEIDELVEEWKDVSYNTLQYLIVNSYKQQLWSRVLCYENMMKQHGQKPYSALYPLIQFAQKQLNSSVSPLTPISPVSASSIVSTPTTPTEVKEKPNTLQFLEKRITAIPEFVPKRVSYSSNSISVPFQSSPMLPLRGSLSTWEPVAEPVAESVTEPAEGALDISLDDLDFDLTTDYDFFNEMDRGY